MLLSLSFYLEIFRFFVSLFWIRSLPKLVTSGAVMTTIPTLCNDPGEDKYSFLLKRAATSSSFYSLLQASILFISQGLKPGLTPWN